MPPTGRKCEFDPANLSLPAQARLVKVSGDVGQGDTDSDSDPTSDPHFIQLTDCLEGQQLQLTGLATEFSAMRTNVVDMQQGVQQILDAVKPPAGAVGGSPFSSTPIPQSGVLPPLFGGIKPAAGPLPYSDSEGEEDSDSEGDRRRREKRKRRQPFDLSRHLPQGVRKPATFHSAGRCLVPSSNRAPYEKADLHSLLWQHPVAYPVPMRQGGYGDLHFRAAVSLR